MTGKKDVLILRGDTQDSNDFAIGNRSDATNRPFIGMIDDVQVYDYALDQDEIVYVAGGPAGYFPLDASANLVNPEPPGSRVVNFRDYAELMTKWLEEKLWPE